MSVDVMGVTIDLVAPAVFFFMVGLVYLAFRTPNPAASWSTTTGPTMEEENDGLY